MTGLVVRHSGKEHIARHSGNRLSIILSLIAHRNEFILEGGDVAYFSSVKDDMEFEFEVIDLSADSASSSKENPFQYIDEEYSNMLAERTQQYEWNQKLADFYQIREVLLEEGLI